MCYSTAQRQLDTCAYVVGWILSGEHYIMCSIFEWAPLRSCLHQVNCLACEPTIIELILNELLNEAYNINSTYIHDKLMNIFSVCSNWSLNPLSYLKAAHVQYISCPTVWLGVENGSGVENGYFIGDWISINLFKFVQSVCLKVWKYFIS